MHEHSRSPTNYECTPETRRYRDRDMISGYDSIISTITPLKHLAMLHARRILPCPHHRPAFIVVTRASQDCLKNSLALIRRGPVQHPVVPTGCCTGPIHRSSDESQRDPLACELYREPKPHPLMCLRQSNTGDHSRVISICCESICHGCQ